MKLLNSIASSVGQMIREYRSSLDVLTTLGNPASWLLDIFGGSRTDSGVRVTELTALQVSTVFTCVDLIGGIMGSLPKRIFEQQLTGNFKRPVQNLALDHPVYDLIHDQPNPEMTSFQLFKTALCHDLLWGNAYVEIQRDGGNGIVGLWPCDPACTKPYRDTPTSPLYYVTSQGAPQSSQLGGTRRIALEDMIHVPGLSLDGRLGLNVIQLARQLVGLALAADKFAATFFGNGAVVDIALQHPGKLAQGAAETLARTFKEAHSGDNAHRPLVLESGMTANKIGTQPNEAQMLETRKANREEVCSLFHVFPHMIGITGQTTRATGEQLGVEFVNYTLSPWITAWQQEMRRKLLPRPRSGPNAAKRYVILFDTWKLTFPDGESRSKYYASGRQWGYFNPNDILGMEDKNPIDGQVGEQYLVPVNMVPAEKAGEVAKQPATNPDAGGMGGNENKGSERSADLPTGPRPENEPQTSMARSALPEPPYFGLFQDAMGRAAVRDKNDLRGFHRCLAPVLCAIDAWVNSGGKWIDGQSGKWIDAHIRAMHQRAMAGETMINEYQAAIDAAKLLGKA